MHNNILLTGFRNTSAELLLKDTHGFKTIILPNDRIVDAQMLIGMISKESFDLVISVGQRPNIKNKVHIETTAADAKDSVVTGFDCCGLAKLFEKKGIPAQISYNAGTSYCNQLYLNGLRYLYQNNSATQMVFIHIPFEKNITDFADFQKRFYSVVEVYRDCINL